MFDECIGAEACLVFVYLKKNIMKDKELKQKCKSQGMYPLSYFLKVFDAYSKASKGDLIDEDIYDEQGGIENAHKRDVWNKILKDDLEPES